jgi:restriction-modification system family protein
MDFRIYSVSRRDKEPLLSFIIKALEGDGCHILYASPADEAPFRITFETPAGERLGIVVYAFLANSKLTKNRPEDEHRFQVKYSSKDEELHSLWQDPYLLYTTLFCGIDPERGIFVGADPVLHSPTRFFISIEFKRHHVEAIQKNGWFTWEREHRAGDDKPVEVLVGGTAKNFLRYVRFEREAMGEEQGHRQLLAEKISNPRTSLLLQATTGIGELPPPPQRLHALVREFEMDESQVLDLIANARRLKMAVRGWVAEEHLVRRLRMVPGITECERVDEEGSPDVRLRFEGSRLIRVECKNVLRQTAAGNVPRLDFQRTRAAKGDPCSRYYSPDDFDVVAACLHAVTEKWEFRYMPTRQMEPHARCPGKLANNVRVGDGWAADIQAVLREVA